MRTNTEKKKGRIGIVLGVVCLFCSVNGAAAKECWIGSWVSGRQLTEPGNLPLAPGLTNTTVRQGVHVTLGGCPLRVQFSNAYGTSPVTLNEVHAAGYQAMADAIDLELFKGKE